MLSLIETTPIPDQKPGTSGLRKKVREFQQPHYLENFVQAIFDVVERPAEATLVLGGDGRYYNRNAIRIIIRMAAANGYARLIIGQGGLLSTPAVSHLIRKYGASGGIILSASHNPGGPDADFGIKYNGANGGPATEDVTQAIYARTLEIDRYRIEDETECDIDCIGAQSFAGMTIEIVDPVADYAELMAELFDFDAIRGAVGDGLTLAFDAMHAITGPYATEIFENRLGFAKGTVLRGEPLEDFGGLHPDPNLVHAKALYDRMMRSDAPEIGAASDGDGDRNLIIGRECFVTPSDSLAVLSANAHHAPAYTGGIVGIARSMPTSAAADRVAAARDIACHETPTGWKFFGSLLDAEKVTICGEESAGTGSDHVREKDGIWAVLLWLNILAVRKMSVAAVMADHWQQFGRNYYARHDYEGIDSERADALIADLATRLPELPEKQIGCCVIERADNFSYTDPVDGSHSADQGLRIFLRGGDRIVVRLSGTGTSGATLRVYLDRYEAPEGDLTMERGAALSNLTAAAQKLLKIAEYTGRTKPDVIT
ncbi:MAG: alpha-D-glucose phosphate-specific phosphoglucomutase [Pontixanthobacter sp.]